MSPGYYQKNKKRKNRRENIIKVFLKMEKNG